MGLVKKMELIKKIMASLKLAHIVLSKKKITVYIGWVGYQNLGDELIFQAYKKMFPNLNFLVQNIETEIYPVLKFLIKIFNIKIITALGGGTLINQSEDWFKLTKEYAALSKYCFCVGTGVANEKYWTRDKNFLIEWAGLLKRFNKIGLRDNSSVNKLKTKGIKSDLKVVGDACFYLTKDGYAPKTNHKVIGINLTHKPYETTDINYKKLDGLITDLIKSLLKKDWKILLLPLNPEDKKALLKIKKRFNDNNLKLLNSEKETLMAIEKCDIILGERLHSGVIAAMKRVPFMLISYQDKIKSFMESINFSEFCIKDKELKESLIIKKIGKLMRKNKEYKQYLDKQVRLLLDKQRKFVKEIQGDIEKI